MQSSDRDTSLRAPLIDPFAALAQHAFQTGDNYAGLVSVKRLAKEFVDQLALAGPLAINLMTANAVACINLFFVARGGTMQLAAAALGNNVAVMLGRLVLLGLCGALDTLAAQAWGAGKERRLPLLMQRTVLFLWLHCVAISGAMLLLPVGLQALGQDPGLSLMVRRYLLALLPAVWLEALSRPITRVLVARGTVTPQMVIALVGLPLNVATNYALVVAAGWEYVGAAAAMSAAAGYDVVLLLLYVAVSGQWEDVIGSPTKRAFQGWRQLVRLAYPAASMKCAESWAFTICTLAASLLPNACIATAAVGVSYNVYGVLFIAFVACSTAACVTVGNQLGAGDGPGAKLSAAASLLVVPPAWGLAAFALLVPSCQDAILSLFVTEEESGPAGGGGAGGGDDGTLRHVLRHMFMIVAGLVLLDGIQTVLSGIIQGCGRQRAGALVNLVAFYVFALPLALWLAFRLQLPPQLGGGMLGLGLGPEGLYLGMAAGPAIQTVCYVYILLQTNWEVVSQAAMAAAVQSTNSLAGLTAIRRMDPGALVGPPLARSGGSSSTGMGGIGPYPWLLPAIEERPGEGRDSSESLGTAAAGSRGGSSWMLANGNLLAQAFGGGARVAVGGGGEEDGWLLCPSGVTSRSAGGSPVGSPGAVAGGGPGSFGLRNGTEEGGSGRGGGAGRGGAGRVRPAGAEVVAPRRQTSRLRSGGSGTAAPATLVGSPTATTPAVTTWPGGNAATAGQGPTAAVMALTLPGPCVDVSPGTAARSQALIMTHGSPPTTDPVHHCLLAATLEPSSPAATIPAAYVFVPGSQGSCHSPTALPGVLHANSPPHAAAAGTSAPMPVPLPSSAKVAAAASGAAAAPRMGAGAAQRWFLFGWGRAQVPTSAKPATKGPPDLTPPDVVSIAAAAGSSTPLQLPGVATAPVPCGSAPGSTTSTSVTMGVSRAGAGPDNRSGTGTGTWASPPLVDAAVMGAPHNRSVVGMAHGCGPPCSVTVGSAASSADTSSSAGEAGGQGQTGLCRAARGEVFRSCESLAAALPSSGDFYTFSASVGTDGAGWLDAPAPVPLEPVQPSPSPPQQQQPLTTTTTTTTVRQHPSPRSGMGARGGGCGGGSGGSISGGASGPVANGVIPAGAAASSLAKSMLLAAAGAAATAAGDGALVGCDSGDLYDSRGRGVPMAVSSPVSPDPTVSPVYLNVNGDTRQQQ